MGGMGVGDERYAWKHVTVNIMLESEKDRGPNDTGAISSNIQPRHYLYCYYKNDHHSCAPVTPVNHEKFDATAPRQPAWPCPFVGTPPTTAAEALL